MKLRREISYLVLFGLSAMPLCASPRKAESRPETALPPLKEELATKSFRSGKGYSITPPIQWTVLKQAMGTDVMFMRETSENVNVVVRRARRGTTAEKERRATITEMKKLFPDYRVLSQGKAVIDGKPALTLRATWTMAKESPLLETRIWFVVQNGFTYAFTCTAPANRFSRFVPTFHKVISSVRWRKITEN